MIQRRCPPSCPRRRLRREFFRATPAEVKAHLAELTGEMLEYTDLPEALEYRQSSHGRQEDGSTGVRQTSPDQRASSSPIGK